MAEVRTVVIRYGEYRSNLNLSSQLRCLSIPNWRKLLRVAIDTRAPWPDWLEENRCALQEIRAWLPELIKVAKARAAATAERYQMERKPVTGDPIKRSCIKKQNDELKTEAKSASSEYKRLSRILAVFEEETQNYNF